MRHTPILQALTRMKLRAGELRRRLLASPRDATNHGRAEAALREREHLYRTLTEASPSMIGLIRDGRIIYLNAAGASLCGYDQADDLIGRPVADLLHPKYRSLAAARMRLAAEGNDLPPVEIRILRPDGECRDVEVSGRQVTYDGAPAVQFIGHDTTERNRIRRDQVESSRMLSAVVNASPAAIYILSPDGRVKFWNAAAGRIFGFTAVDVLGKPLPTLPEDARSELDQILELARGPQPFLGREYRRVRKDGTPVDVSLSAAPLDIEGAGAALLVVAVDVTQRKAAERALSESERLFAQLAENIPQVFWMSSLDKQKLLYVSAMYDSVWGRPHESLYENPLEWLEAIHPEDRERVLAAIPRQATGAYDEEYRVVRPDGSVRWVRDRAFPIRNTEGKVHRVAGIAEDVTDARRRDDELRLLAAAISQAAEGVIVTDATGAIEYVNPAFERITGYSRGEVRGRNPRFLKSGRQDARFYERMWATLVGGETWRANFVNVRKDGTQYTQESLITPVRERDGRITHYIAVLRDVTREATLEEQLRQAQKMEAVGRLAGGVAHDFNNVLSVIMGSAQFALNELEPSHPATADIQQVLDASDRAAKLTRQLLTFGKRQIVQPRVLEISEVLRDAEKMLRRLISEDVELDISVAPGLWRVTADPTSIDQVLFNLVINARDAMPHGGHIAISADNAHVTSDEVDGVSERVRRGRYVRLRVSDTGTGMDAATRQRIFEPFFTTKSDRGTGLGLAIVFGIVKQSGGHITVESEPGTGAVFDVYLPATAVAAEIAPSGAPAAGKRRHAGTVLVAEDQAHVRTTVRRMLEEFGYTVIEAEHGEHALSIWERQRDEIHLVLTDLVMPRMGGHELARQVRASAPQTPVLLMTGYAEPEVSLHEVLNSGVQLIQKPFQAATLEQKIREVRGLGSRLQS